MEGEAPGDIGELVIVGADLPDLLAGRGVHRIDLPAQIAEIGHPAFARPRHRDRAAHPGVGVEGPAHAAGPGVQRIDRVGRRPEKGGAADDGRLAIGADHAGNGEGPFQLETRHVGGRQTGPRRRLEALIGDVAAPAVPELPDLIEGCRPDGAEGLGRQLAAGERLAGDIGRHRPRLARAQRPPLRRHHPVDQRLDHPLRLKAFQRRRAGRTRHAALMAGGALFMEDRGAVTGGEGAGHPERREQRQADQQFLQVMSPDGVLRRFSSPTD